MSGWGSAIGKIFDWLPGRKESRRNKEAKLRREYEEILKKDWTPALAVKLEHIAKQLRIISEKNKND